MIEIDKAPTKIYLAIQYSSRLIIANLTLTDKDYKHIKLLEKIL